MDIKVVLHTSYRGKDFIGTVKIRKGAKNIQQAVVNELAKSSRWITVGRHILNVNMITHVTICKTKEEKK